MATSARETSSMRGSRAKVAGPAYRGTRVASTGPTLPDAETVCGRVICSSSGVRGADGGVVTGAAPAVHPAVPFGPDVFRGGRGGQADRDEGDQAGDQAGVDRLVGVDVADHGHRAQ